MGEDTITVLLCTNPKYTIPNQKCMSNFSREEKIIMTLSHVHILHGEYKSENEELDSLLKYNVITNDVLVHILHELSLIQYQLNSWQV